MGNDGGSIPTRRELVKEAHRNPTAIEVKESQKEHLAHRWTICPLSHAPLCKPVVSDCTGILYNKDAVLQYLLPAESSSLNKQDCDTLLQGRIKGLKDVAEVLFDTHTGVFADKEIWICPVTSKELGAMVKAVYLVPCGHAFSQEAIREMKTEECPQCNQAYEAQNIITLFPSTEGEKYSLKYRIQDLSDRGLTHSLKKRTASSKKRKANKLGQKEEAAAADTQINTPKSPGAITQSSKQVTPIPRSDTPTSKSSTPQATTATTNIKHAATASLTAKVLEEENERKKRRVLMREGAESQTLKSLFAKKGKDGGLVGGADVGRGGDKKHRDGDFMTRGFSIRG